MQEGDRKSEIPDPKPKVIDHPSHLDTLKTGAMGSLKET